MKVASDLLVAVQTVSPCHSPLCLCIQITLPHDAGSLAQTTRNSAALYIAAGIDPAKVSILARRGPAVAPHFPASTASALQLLPSTCLVMRDVHPLCTPWPGPLALTNDRISFSVIFVFHVNWQAFGPRSFGSLHCRHGLCVHSCSTQSDIVDSFDYLQD